VGLDEVLPKRARELLDGRYRLGEVRGRGGAATVYEAVDLLLGRPVAVKRYEASEQPLGRDRFVVEARLLAGLCHPGLVTVHDVCLEGDQPYLVMRLVDGPTLRDLLDHGPLEPAATARVGARLADILAYVHAREVVHRDIKPSNVLVDAAGACHLTDFGIARALGTAHLTATGEFVGTAAYLAPEQVTDVDVGPAADIYALGLVLLECLTGETEYTGTTVESALARLSRRPRIPGALPSDWRALLAAMTAQEPAGRPGAARCAQLLTAIAQGRTAVMPALGPEPRAAEPAAGEKRRRIPRGAAHAGLGAVAVAAIITITAMTHPSGPDHPTGNPVQPPRSTTGTASSTATTPDTTLPAAPVTTAPADPDGVPPPAASANLEPAPPATTPVAAGPDKGKGPNKRDDNNGNNGGGKKGKR
jgi:tRNA A-37 threonylcarbamoyl transferase component Bud32